jgi:HD-like signal output (HDOD) protein
MNARVLESIKKSAAVPSVPQVVLRFIQIMQDPEFEYGHLVKALSADPGTVSELLRLANSALFGVRNKVVAPKQALTLLGPKRTRSLLLGRYLVDAMSRRHVASLDMSYFWRRSLTGSVIAARFAQKQIPRMQDEAFIAGLLADIGVPILTEAFPAQYAPIVAEYRPHGACVTCEEELEAVEVTHAEVSAMVLAHWTVPDSVVSAVNLSHSMTPGSGDVATVARILHAADRIGKLLCEVPSAETISCTCSAALEHVGVDEGVLVQLLPTIEADIEDLADALRIDVIPSKGYSLIAKAVEQKLAAAATP